MSEVSGQIRGLEKVGGFGGKAVSLAEGQTYAHDSDFYKKTLATYASITPAAVRAAMQQWLRRPALTIILSPGRARGVHRSEGGHTSQARRQERRRGQGQPHHSARRSAGLAAVPGDHPYAIVERDSGRIRAADHDPGNPHCPVVRCRRRRGQPTGAGPCRHDHEPARRRDFEAQLAGGGGNRGATGRRRQHSERRRPVLCHAERSHAEPFTVARPDEGCGEGCGVPARRYRSPARPGPDRDRAAAEGPDSASPTACCRRCCTAQTIPTPGLRRAIQRPSPNSRATISSRSASAGSDRTMQSCSSCRIVRCPRFSLSSRRVSDNGRHLQVRRASRISRRSRRGRLRRRSCSSIGRARRKSTIVGGELLPIDPRADIVPFDTANDVLGGTFLSRLNMDLRESKGWSYGVNGDCIRSRACGSLCGRRGRAG